MMYRMFDLNISIRTQYHESEHFLRPYLAKYVLCADISIEISDAEIEKEMKKDNTKTLQYHELICIFRHISEEIYDFDGMFIHSAVVEKDGMGFMFTGKSGVGKSTHILKWLEVFGDDVKVINGDKPIVRFFDDGIYAYSNPWNGKENIKAFGKTRLKSVCFLEQGKENKIKKASNDEAFKRLLNQTVIPNHPQRKLKYFELLDSLIKTLDFYIMECDISNESVMLSYNTMRGSI